MRSSVGVLTSVLGLFAVGLFVVAARPPAADAQRPLRGLKVVDEDFGRRLRHAPAYRGKLNVRRSFRAEKNRRSPRAPQWNYHYFDHPKPSYQYFREPRTYKWSYDSFPGLGRYTTTYYYGPPVYYQPYYYDPYPRGRRGGCCERW